MSIQLQNKVSELEARIESLERAVVQLREALSEMQGLALAMTRQAAKGKAA